jgi:DNA-directed RNA polymerase subunit RPC12/RpoP
MADFVYRYTCKGCGAIREVRTLRDLTADQKRHLRQSDCPACQLKGIVKGGGK